MSYSRSVVKKCRKSPKIFQRKLHKTEHTQDVSIHAFLKWYDKLKLNEF